MAEKLGWRWEFGLQVPILLLCAAAAQIAMPSDLGKNKEGKTVRQALQEFDSMGSITVTVAITTLILGLNLGGNVYPCKSSLLKKIGNFSPLLELHNLLTRNSIRVPSYRDHIPGTFRIVCQCVRLCRVPSQDANHALEHTPSFSSCKPHILQLYCSGPYQRRLL